MNDYDQIRNLLAKYSHCADDDDFEGFQALFTPDGVLVEAGFPIPAARLPALMKKYKAVSDAQPQPFGGKHLQMNSVIEVDGDRASAVTDLLSVHLRGDKGWSIGGNGRYTDELARVAGRWLIRRRTVTWYRGTISTFVTSTTLVFPSIAERTPVGR